MEVKFEPDDNLKIHPSDWDTILKKNLRPPNPTFSTKGLKLDKKLQLEPHPSIGDLAKLAKIAYSGFDDAKKELECKFFFFNICHLCTYVYGSNLSTTRSFDR